MEEASSQSSIGSRITRYSTILAVSGMVCKLMLLVYTVLAVDILGKERFGRIEYFFEMAIIFTVLIDFGMEQTVTREIARRRDQLQKILYPLVVFRFLSSLLGSGVMIFFLWLAARAEHTLLLMLCAVSYFFIVYHSMLIRAVVRGFELLAYEGLANLLEKVIHIGLALMVLFVLPKLPLIMLCYTAGALMALIIYWWVIVKRYGFHRHEYTLSTWMEWRKLAFPIGLSAACILLLHREDTAMVNWIRGDAETGLYRAPYRFLEGLFLFPQVLAISAYPIFSKLYHEKRHFSESAALLLRALMMISLPMAVGGTCIADEMIMFLTPDIAPEGGTVFKILVWSLPFIYANFLLGTILNATDRQRYNVHASAWGLVCNAVLNIPAIIFYGAFGASVVTVISQGLYGLIMFYHNRDFQLITQRKRYLAILLSCAGMALVLQWVERFWVTEIIIGVVVYGGLLLLLRGVPRRDLEKLFAVLKRK